MDQGKEAAREEARKEVEKQKKRLAASKGVGVDFDKWMVQLENTTLDAERKLMEEASDDYIEAQRLAAEAAAKKKKERELLEWARARAEEEKRRRFCGFCGKSGDHEPADCPSKPQNAAKLKLEAEAKLRADMGLPPLSEAEAAVAALAAAESKADLEKEAEAARGKKTIYAIPPPSEFLDKLSDKEVMEDGLKWGLKLAKAEKGIESRAAQDAIQRLSLFYKRRGELSECEKMFNEMVEERELAHGPFDKALIMPLTQLAIVLEEQKKWEEAYFTWERCWDCQKKVSKSHPDKVRAAEGLKRTFVELGGTEDGVLLD